MDEFRAIFGGSEEDAQLIAGRNLVVRTAICLKLATMYSLNNQAFDHPVKVFLQSLHALLEESPTLVLRTDGGNVYLNGQPVKLDAQTHESAQTLRAIFTRLHVNMLTVTAHLSERDFRLFLERFKQAYSGRDAAVGPGAGAATGRDKIAFGTDDSKASTSTNTVAIDPREFVLQSYATLVVCIQEVLADLADDRQPKLARLRRSLQMLVDAAKGRGSLLVAIATLQQSSGLPAYHLAATVALCIVMSERLALKRTTLVDLLMGAALHETGLAELPPPVDPQEFDRALQQVPVRSVLHNLSGSITLGSLKRAGLAHEHHLPVHDRVGIKGGPSSASQLIGVACAFDTMTAKHAPGLGQPPEQALRYILYGAGARFGTVATKLLANAVGLFPIGTTVMLSNGATAVVVKGPTEPRFFGRPKVRLVDPGTGAMGKGLDLAKQSKLSIRASVDPVNLDAVMAQFLRV